MSYRDYDAFDDFMQDWMHRTMRDEDVTALWNEVRDRLPETVIKAALWTENEFARELLKQAVVRIGAERIAAGMVAVAAEQVERPLRQPRARRS